VKVALRSLTILIVSVFLATAVQAREAVPIINYENQLVAKPLTIEQVKQAIVTAAATNSWTITKGPTENSVTATLVVRNKHTVIVNITYSKESFSVVYAGSINMKYQPNAGTGVIHPFYNKWSRDLVDTIQANLERS
jgi:hypothetical protein